MMTDVLNLQFLLLKTLIRLIKALCPQQYSRWMEGEEKGRFNFDGSSTPMKLDEITKFKKNNDLEFNVFHIAHDGYQISPLRSTDTRLGL